MATVRRKGKGSKHGHIKSTKTAKSNVEEEEDELVTLSSEDDTEESRERGQSPFSNMSLDVLAQVASETLEKEPTGISARKLTRRSVLSRDYLNLSQINQLSSRSLVDFFCELKANEMTRNYTFVCFLLPDKCQQQFSSFGNDNRSRLKMENHLRHHLKELAAEEKQSGENFSAEPMPARIRRLKEAGICKKKKKGLSFAKNKLQQEGVFMLPKGQLISLSEIANANCSSEESSPQKRKGKSRSQGKDDSENASPEKAVEGDKLCRPKRKLNEEIVRQSKRQTRFRAAKDDQASVSESVEILPTETERRIEENEQFIIDLLLRTQPHMDHCYTTIFGKKRSAEVRQLEVDSASEEEDEGTSDVTVDVGDIDSYYGSLLHKTEPAEPILLFRRIPGEEGTPMVCCEEIVGELYDEAEDDEGHSGEKPYPPMPKSALAKKGRIPVPEENVSFSDEEEIATPKSPKRKKKMGDKIKEPVSGDWERKWALRCIRELKGRRKDDNNTPLVCKICQTKTFTACATLMYHYRSHAGIKPFVCLICNTTFTRQHSLNYHMLIHNNQSRFTCKECGRKFRHPSHFKEHLRRHTGETPFECMDCPQKFKTRNTYKRHLKTRHGKLLTAGGIHVLSREEFLLVRTKPYRKGEDSDEDEEDIPEEDLLDSAEEISVTDDKLNVITQSNGSLPLQINSQELPPSTMHGHVLPSGHFLVPVDLQFVMTT